MNIDVQLASDGSSRHFDNVEQLQQWIKTESHFWNWLQRFANRAPLDTTYRQALKTWNRATQQINDLSNAANENKDQRIQEIVGIVSTVYTQNHAILSDSPRAQFIEMLRRKNEEEAGFALLTFLKPNDVPTSNPVAIVGMLKAQLFDMGISTDVAISEKEALRVISEKWTSFMNEAGKEHSNLTRMREQGNSDIAVLLREESDKCESIRSAAKESFAALEHIFRQKLALLAPVTYWADKAKKHQAASLWLGASFLGAGAVMALFVWMALQHFVIGQSGLPAPLSPDHPTTPTTLTPEYWRYAIPVALATILIWPMRIIARMLFSNLHLREDALERVTMVNTYLSLSESKQGLKDDDRKLILEMLFRPSATGIVQDDASPPSLLTYMSKASSGRH